MPDVGDNSTAVEPREIAKDEIERALAPLWDRFNQLRTSADKAVIVDDDTAKKVVDLDAMFQALLARLDIAHDQVKLPYLEAGRVVDGLCNALLDQVKPIRERLGGMLTAFQKAEAAKIEAARAAEREAEKEDPEPGFVAPEPQSARRAAGVRGNFGAKASLRSKDVVVINDVKKLPRWVLENVDVQAAMKKVIRPVLKAGNKVGGALLIDEEKSVTSR